MTEQELEKREKVLRTAMERLLPDFVKSCKEIGDSLLIHQDDSVLTTTSTNCWEWLSSLPDYMGKNSTSSGKIGKR
jgi:hypothetical protein